MNDFIDYIKKPAYPEGFVKINWGIFFLMLLMYVIFTVSILLIPYIAMKLTGITRSPFHFTLYQKVLFGIVLAPIYEEILCRVLLVFNRKNLAVFVACCAIFFVYFFVKSNPRFIIFSGLIAFSSVVYLYFDRCYAFISNHYRLFFYFTAILFGLLHIFNFTGVTYYNLVFTPLLVLPQLFMGLILGYLRVRYGFRYGVLFHAVVNTAILLG